MSATAKRPPASQHNRLCQRAQRAAARAPGLIGLVALPYLPAVSRSGRIDMRSFIIACVSAVVIAAIGALFLGSLQEPASVAFTTQSARI